MDLLAGQTQLIMYKQRKHHWVGELAEIELPREWEHQLQRSASITRVMYINIVKSSIRKTTLLILRRIGSGDKIKTIQVNAKCRKVNLT